MEVTKNPMAFLPLALAFLLCFAACAESRMLADEQKQEKNEGEVTWCIAKPSTANYELYQNIEYSCKQQGVDCAPFAPGGSCFSPDNLVSHASVAMNLYYKSAGKHSWNCHFSGSGLIITQDPSTGTCIYPA